MSTGNFKFAWSFYGLVIKFIIDGTSSDYAQARAVC